MFVSRKLPSHGRRGDGARPSARREEVAHGAGVDRPVHEGQVAPHLVEDHGWPERGRRHREGVQRVSSVHGPIHLLIVTREGRRTLDTSIKRAYYLEMTTLATLATHVSVTPQALWD